MSKLTKTCNADHSISHGYHRSDCFPPGPQVPKNRDGVQWSWQRTTQDPVTWGRSFTVRKPCPTPVLHPDQEEPLQGSRRRGVKDCFLNKCARKEQEILMLINLSISEQNKELRVTHASESQPKPLRSVSSFKIKSQSAEATLKRPSCQHTGYDLNLMNNLLQIIPRTVRFWLC